MSQIYLHTIFIKAGLLMSHRIKLLFNIALILNLFIFINSPAAKAQVPNWEWAQGAGSVGSVYLKNSSTIDANGDIYISGSYLSNSITFGATTLINTDTTGNTCDFFVVKYDAAGNVIWAKGEGGAKNDFAMGIATDVFGNVYVTGSYSSETITIGIITLTNSDTTNNSRHDMFLIKYNPLGNVQWVKTSSNNNFWDIGNSVSTDALGNVFVTGAYQFGMVLGTVTLPSYYGWHVFTAKYDSSGNVLWARTGIPNFGDADLGTSVAVDNSGNAYVTGYFNASNLHFGEFTLTRVDSTSFGNDIFVVKYDGSGNVLWAKSAGGIGVSGYQRSTSITTDNANNCYVVGYFLPASIQFGNYTLLNEDSTGSGHDIFIAKYDPSGNVLWAKRAGGEGNDDGANSVATDASGNVFLGGYYNSSSILFGTNILTNSNTTGDNYDSYLAKYDTFGNAQWAIGIGDVGSESVKCICVSTSSDIYLAGFFSSPSIVLGAETIINSGGNGDMFIGKLNSLTVSIQETNPNNEINIFPNPSTNQLTIKYRNSDAYPLRIEIIDAWGRTTSNTVLNSSPAVLSGEISNLASGVYIYRITDNKNNIIKQHKLIKQ